MRAREKERASSNLNEHSSVSLEGGIRNLRNLPEEGDALLPSLYCHIGPTKKGEKNVSCITIRSVLFYVLAADLD
jgi:hypothetical protein